MTTCDRLPRSGKVDSFGTTTPTATAAQRLAPHDRVRYVRPDGRHEALARGDIGYILEDHGAGHYEVEFSRTDGTTTFLGAMAGSDLEKAD